MPGTWETGENVAALQGEVIDQSNVVFDQMLALAASATDEAMNANLTVNTSSLPTAPVFPDVELTVSDFLAALAYLEALKNLLLTAPVYPADYAETDYSSTLLTALVNLLYADLTDGGHGIDTDDEENLWNRARERVIKESQSEGDAATRQFAIAGFPMPTGAAQMAQQQVQQKASEAIATANRDISIKRADMYVENRKHAISASTEVEKIRMGNFNSRMDRLLEHYKANVTKITEDYRVRAQVYASIAGAYVNLYSSNAGLAQAQAQLAIGEITAKVAVYRAEMDKVFEAAKLDLESKKTKASIYMALATAAMSAINVNTSLGAQAQSSESIQGSVSEQTQTTHNYNY